jgi:hypothetical protein
MTFVGDICISLELILDPYHLKAPPGDWLSSFVREFNL